MPPALAWFYLLVVDPFLTPFWFPYASTLLLIAIAALIGWALYSYQVELRRRKPALIAGYDARRLALAGRRPQQEAPAAASADDDDDDNDDVYESFTAD